MSKEICPMCAEEICICGEAYKTLGASQLEVLIPILVRQYENLPEYNDSMARHVNFYGSVTNLIMAPPAPRFREHPGINSDLYFGRPQQSGYASRHNDSKFRYDMLIPGLLVRWGEHHGKLLTVTERKSEADVMYKMLSVEDPEKGVAWFATSSRDNYNWPDLDGRRHTNVRILDMFIEVPDEMREEVANHLVSIGHEYVHRKLALMFGTRHSSLSEGLELGKPPYGFGHEGRTSTARQEMFRGSVELGGRVMGASSRRLIEDGERNPDNADDRFEQIDLRKSFADNRMSLTGHGRVLRQAHERMEHVRDSILKYRRLSPGAKFKFLDTISNDFTTQFQPDGFTGEWVVTAFQLYDEDKGPKMQVACISAVRADQVSTSFYTSYSPDQIDENMVPFVSMEHIEILDDSWDIVEEPSFSEFKALKVGKTMGVKHLADESVKFDIREVEYRQRNYGISSPESYIVIVKFAFQNPEKGEEDITFTIYTGNVTPMTLLFVPDATYVPASDIIFHD